MRRERDNLLLAAEKQERHLAETCEALRFRVRELEGLHRQTVQTEKSSSTKAEAYHADLKDALFELAKAQGALAAKEQREAQLVLEARSQASREYEARLEREAAKMNAREKEHWSEIGKKQTELELLQGKLMAQREKYRAKEHALKVRVADVEKENEQIKAKWKSSITAKKKRVVTTTLPAPAKENSGGARANRPSAVPVAAKSGRTALSSSSSSGASAAGRKPSFR